MRAPTLLGQVMMVAGALMGGLLGETWGLRPAVVVLSLGYAIPFLYALASPLRTEREATRSRTPGPAEE